MSNGTNINLINNKNTTSLISVSKENRSFYIKDKYRILMAAINELLIVVVNEIGQVIVYDFFGVKFGLEEFNPDVIYLQLNNKYSFIMLNTKLTLIGRNIVSSKVIAYKNLFEMNQIKIRNENIQKEEQILDIKIDDYDTIFINTTSMLYIYSEEEKLCRIVLIYNELKNPNNTITLTKIESELCFLEAHELLVPFEQTIEKYLRFGLQNREFDTINRYIRHINYIKEIPEKATSYEFYFNTILKVLPNIIDEIKKIDKSFNNKDALFECIKGIELKK